MNIRYIYGGSGSGKSNLCINEIYEKSKDKSKNIIYIVPEQFTLQSEKKLVTKFHDKVILNIHILSFKRLAHTLFSEIGMSASKTLGDIGKLMLIRKITYENSKNLFYFKKSIDKDGFLENISKSITEFFTYNITSSELEKKLESLKEKPNLYEKMRDLIFIYKEYLSYLKDEYISSDDTLDLLSEKIKDSALIKNSEIWIDEFNGFTPQEFKVLKELFKYAGQVNITFCLDSKKLEYRTLNDYDPFYETKKTINKLNTSAREANAVFLPHTYLKNNIRQKKNPELLHLSENYLNLKKEPYLKKTENIKIIGTKNKYAEINALCANILSLVRDYNYMYKNIAVILGDIEYEYIIKSSFSQYDIPYFIDTKKDITSNRIIELVCSFFDIFTSNWDYEPIFRFLKTYLTPLESLDVSILENYVLECGIKGKSWFAPKWEYGFSNPNFNQDDINYLKDCFIECLKPFTDYIKPRKKYKVKEISLRLYNFLEALHLEETLSYKETPECFQVYKILMELLDKIVEILGEQEVNILEYSKILNSGIKSCKTGHLPQTQDEVIIGDLKRTRLSGIKILFILTVNDGIIPSISKDSEIFSDDDKSYLNLKGIELSPTSFLQTSQENFLLYKMFSKPTDKLYLSYIAESDGKEKRPSKVISTVKKIFPKLKEATEKPSPLEKITLSLPTFTELSIPLFQYSKGEPLDNIYKDLYTIYSKEKYYNLKLNKMTDEIFTKKYEDTISENLIESLYGKNLHLSTTKLEKYASCPFAYFMNYGLEAKSRKIYEVSNLDIGLVFHKILEDFSKYIYINNLKWENVTDKKIKEIIDASIENILNDSKNKIFSSSSKYKFILDSIKKVSEKSIKALSDHLKNGEFSPLDFEIGFGPKTSLPAIVIELKNNSKLILTGTIDRIDVLRKEGKNYVKIIDYKTGEIDYNLSDVYYGLKLQLLIYLDEIIKKGETLIGENIVPGGIFYFKIHEPFIDLKDDINTTNENIKNQIINEFKMDGLILNDISLIKMIDKIEGKKTKVFPLELKSDGTFYKSSEKKLATAEEFEALRTYVILLAEKFGNEILQGNIKISPYEKSSSQPNCVYCEFSPICQIKTDERNNVRKLKSLKNPLKEIMDFIKNNSSLE